MASGLLDDDLLNWVRTDFPSPIAQAARRFQAAPDDAGFHEALPLGETFVVTLGTIALAWCHHRFHYPGGVKSWYEKLERSRVSLGDWLEAARGGAALAWDTGTPLAGLALALGGKDSRLLA